ncbi:MAG: hypothetical protein L0I24_10015 [Pseudonocardia sp.]|nr:hypothetical protein [Pseudonocardia sp.]
MAQARAAGTFTALHQRYWDLARHRLGDGAGTRALIAVLLLHRSMPAAAVAAGMTAALAGDRIDADLVAVEARRHLEPTGESAVTTIATVPTATATARIGVLAAVRAPGGARSGCETRPAPSLAGYDELLAAGGAR